MELPLEIMDDTHTEISQCNLCYFRKSAWRPFDRLLTTFVMKTTTGMKLLMEVSFSQTGPQIHAIHPLLYLHSG